MTSLSIRVSIRVQRLPDGKGAESKSFFILPQTAVTSVCGIVFTQMQEGGTEERLTRCRLTIEANSLSPGIYACLSRQDLGVGSREVEAVGGHEVLTRGHMRERA